jgi:hypothetical protein
MAFTRNDLCIRVLGMLNRLDVDTPAEAGDVQLINGLIDATVDRLLNLNLIRRDPTTGLSSIDFGTAANLSSGAIPNNALVALARVLTRDVANDFGADPDAYEKQAQQGEDTLARIRFKGTGAPPAAPSGNTYNRLQLIYETLMALGIVSVNEPASSDAIDRVNRVINPVMAELSRQNVYAPNDPGSFASLTSGAFPDSDVAALSQVLARPAAISFGPKFIQGQVSEYIQLAAEGEARLRRMKLELQVDEPISFRDY